MPGRMLTLCAPIAEDTTLMSFRHLLEKHKPAHATLTIINGHLKEKGFVLRQVC